MSLKCCACCGSKLYAKPSKCEFGKSRVEFVGHIITRQGVQADARKLAAIRDWPVPATVRDVRSFVGLASFYRRFIPHFATVAAPLTSLMSNKLTGPLPWGPEQQSAFERLKAALTDAPVLASPAFDAPFILRTDASQVGLGAVLSQKQPDGRERVVAYHSRKLSPAESRYTVHERELLGVVDATRVWRHYLAGRQFTLQTDNWANKHLQTQPHLDPKRQAGWMQKLQEYDFEIAHIPGKANVVADLLSRRADYAPPDASLAALHADVALPDSDFSKQLRTDAASDPIYQSSLERVRAGRHPELVLTDGLLYWQGPSSTGEEEAGLPARLYIPQGTLRSKLLHEAHAPAYSGHLGRAKTLDLLQRHYFWPGMSADVHRHVETCPLCQKNKSTNQRPIGLLQPLPVPGKRWEVVSMDLITQLPPCANTGHDAAVVFVDLFSKAIHIAPTTTTVTAEGVARLFFDHVFRLHGMPRTIVSDRDPRFTSKFWKALFGLTGTKLAMSTAHHPQTDGQTERANRTIEAMLRSYVSPHQDDWDRCLTAVEFAYNNSLQASTGFTPFQLLYGEHPHTPLSLQTNAPSPTTNVAAAQDFIERLDKDLRAATSNLERAKQRQAQQANKKRRDHAFKVGDRVILSQDFVSHSSSAPTASNASAKLGPRWYGPFTVTKVVTPVSVELALPDTWRIWPVIHVSNLLPWREGGDHPPLTVPDPDIINGEEHHHVEAIRNHRHYNRYLQYLIKWTGKHEEHNSWEFAEDLAEDMDPQSFSDLVDAYAHACSLRQRATEKTETKRRSSRLRKG